MKICLTLPLLLAAAEARLFHLPLGGSDKQNGDPRRRLADASAVDQDNLYQARGVQYVDLKVGA